MLMLRKEAGVKNGLAYLAREWRER